MYSCWTGGTMLGVSRSIKNNQKLLGFLSVNDRSRINYISNNMDSSINYELIKEFTFGGFGKFNNELILFINSFKKNIKFHLIQYTQEKFFLVFLL